MEEPRAETSVTVAIRAEYSVMSALRPDRMEHVTALISSTEEATVTSNSLTEEA